MDFARDLDCAHSLNGFGADISYLDVPMVDSQQSSKSHVMPFDDTQIGPRAGTCNSDFRSIDPTFLPSQVIETIF